MQVMHLEEAEGQERNKPKEKKREEQRWFYTLDLPHHSIILL